MAYLNLLASVPEPEVERLRQDPSFVVAPSLVLGASHLIGYWVQVQPLGGLLGRALDGGQALHPDLWHPLRPPGYHPPPVVAQLSQGIDDAWRLVLAGQPPEDVEWLSFEVDRLLKVFRHATGSGECVVSALEAPADEERASKVRLPWSPAAKEARAMIEQRFPKGWDEQRVRSLIAELDARTEDEWIAADEAAASEDDEQAVVTVPMSLLPEVRRLLATHKTA